MWKLLSAVALVLVCDAAYLKARQSEATLNLRDESPCSEKCKAKPMEMAFVVDASASIWPQNFTLGLNFIEDFVGFFDIGEEKGSIRVIGGSLQWTMGSIRVIGGFSPGDQRFHPGCVCPLVTYGEVVYTQDAFNFGDYTNKGQLLKAITEIPYRSGLRTNTSGGICHVFVVDNYHMLQSIEDRLAYEACDECQNDPVDLAFVIDSSVSIGDADFEVGMEFIRQFVDAFHISPDAVRVAAIAFGERYFEEDAFNFDEYDNKNDVMSALQNIPWRHGSATNTSEGLKYMREYLMPAARPNAAHVYTYAQLNLLKKKLTDLACTGSNVLVSLAYARRLDGKSGI
nr:hypothetical protein BaRGS_035278 [Batillaria attramentaria]